MQEKLLLDPMFEVPRSDITAVHVDEEAVLGKGPVEYSRKQESSEQAGEDTTTVSSADSNKDNGKEADVSRTGHTQGSSVAV